MVEILRFWLHHRAHRGYCDWLRSSSTIQQWLKHAFSIRLYYWLQVFNKIGFRCSIKFVHIMFPKTRRIYRHAESVYIPIYKFFVRTTSYFKTVRPKTNSNYDERDWMIMNGRFFRRTPWVRRPRKSVPYMTKTLFSFYTVCVNGCPIKVRYLLGGCLRIVGNFQGTPGTVYPRM